MIESPADGEFKRELGVKGMSVTTLEDFLYTLKKLYMECYRGAQRRALGGCVIWDIPLLESGFTILVNLKNALI